MALRLFPKLYKKTSTGAVQEWLISVEGTTIVTVYGQVGGKMQTTEDTVKAGKNAGRKNETAPETQAEKEAEAKWLKQKKAGYVESLKSAEQGKTDELIEGGVIPMLAKKYEEYQHKIVYPVCVQPKLDGHRCVAVIDNHGKVTLWTRTRKQILSVPHIAGKLEEVAHRMSLKNVVLDGELWHPKINNENKPFSRIPVAGSGKFLLIDDEDIPKLKGMKPQLYTNGYAIVRFNRGGEREGKYIHRLVLNEPDSGIDHKNGDKLDNRKRNLRPCNQSQNAANSKKRSTNKSGFRGVMLHSRRGDFHAQITINYERVHIGYFKDPVEAAKAYDKKAFEAWGEFAQLNFPDEHKVLYDFEMLTSAARKLTPTPESSGIQYHIYDVMLDSPFNLRFSNLADILLHGGNDIHLVETHVARDEKIMMELYDKFKADGYEGAMVRQLDAGYENKRSSQLLKVKEFQDDEFPIIGVEEGRGKLQGHAGAFVCSIPGTDRKVNVKMSGATSKLKEYWDEQEIYIGQLLTVKFQGYTGDGIPRFPVGLRIREDL